MQARVAPSRFRPGWTYPRVLVQPDAGVGAESGLAHPVGSLSTVVGGEFHSGEPSVGVAFLVNVRRMMPVRLIAEV